MGKQASKATAEREAAILSRLGARSIVLVGMMGAGKTAVGKRLAQKLNLPFFDADAEIETAAQKTISELFEAEGEAFFRDKERRVIARLLNADTPIVLATGGGAYMNAETRAVIAAKAISIWLRAESDVLWRRVQRKTNRPLLKTPDPEQTLQTLIDTRYPLYAKADLTIDSLDVSHETVLGDVLDSLDAYLRKNGS